MAVAFTDFDYTSEIRNYEATYSLRDDRLKGKQAARVIQKSADAATRLLDIWEVITDKKLGVLQLGNLLPGTMITVIDDTAFTLETILEQNPTSRGTTEYWALRGFLSSTVAYTKRESEKIDDEEELREIQWRLTRLIKGIVVRLVKNWSLSEAELLNGVGSFIDKSIQKALALKSQTFLLHRLSEKLPKEFLHSVEIMVLWLRLSLKRKFPEDRTLEIWSWCLLHDTGKLFLDPKVLHANPEDIVDIRERNAFADYQKKLIELHAVIGYSILYEDRFSALMAGTHHQNGSQGYGIHSNFRSLVAEEKKEGQPDITKEANAGDIIDESAEAERKQQEEDRMFHVRENSAYLRVLHELGRLLKDYPESPIQALILLAREEGELLRKINPTLGRAIGAMFMKDGQLLQRGMFIDFDENIIQRNGNNKVIHWLLKDMLAKRDDGSHLEAGIISIDGTNLLKVQYKIIANIGWKRQLVSDLLADENHAIRTMTHGKPLKEMIFEMDLTPELGAYISGI